MTEQVSDGCEPDQHDWEESPDSGVVYDAFEFCTKCGVTRTKIEEDPGE